MAPNITTTKPPAAVLSGTPPAKAPPRCAPSAQRRAEMAGHAHVFQFWPTLESAQREELLHSVSNIDFDVVNSYFARLNFNGAEAPTVAGNLQPLPADFCGDTATSSTETMAQWRRTGLEEIAAGSVAVVLLAGGQGTRLGSSEPKGLYNVGLPSAKSLFRLQAERIIKAQQLAEAQTGQLCTIPWYIMTSGPVYERTAQHFQENNYFGLNPHNVVFFLQNTLPCLTTEGKVILETPSKVAEAPDGNGGLYRALVTSRVLQHMRARGVKHVHAYCVDNVLVKVADPVFIGFCVQSDADCGAKVVRKRDPNEAVGLFGLVDGQCNVVEYSEITPAAAQERGEDGHLALDAANIVNHFFTVDFLQTVCDTRLHSLPLHVAHKKIPTIDESGRAVRPTSNNGIKLEMFIFDVFRFARNMKVLYVRREDEFSALKNAEGAAADTPTTCREGLMDFCRRMVVAAGGVFDGEDVPCEVSPLVSYDGEGLEKLCKGKVFTKDRPALFL